jgi:hypothetical protein
MCPECGKVVLVQTVYEYWYSPFEATFVLIDSAQISNQFNFRGGVRVWVPRMLLSKLD